MHRYKQIIFVVSILSFSNLVLATETPKKESTNVETPAAEVLEKEERKPAEKKEAKKPEKASEQNNRNKHHIITDDSGHHVITDDDQIPPKVK